MPRTRTIKPSFWEDEKLGRVSMQARLTYIGLWNLSDDNGNVRLSSPWIKANLYSYDEHLRVKDVESWLTELTQQRFIIPYIVSEERYAHIPTFLKHQRIDKPNRDPAFCNPLPPKDAENADSKNVLGSFRERSAPYNEVDIEVELLNHKNDLSAEPQAASPVFITLTLNDKSEHPITQDDVAYWKSIYPYLNVEQEFRAMKGWLTGNPGKRKTARGINRFINGWLERSQNRGNGTQNATTRNSNGKRNYYPDKNEYEQLIAERIKPTE